MKKNNLKKIKDNIMKNKIKYIILSFIIITTIIILLIVPTLSKEKYRITFNTNGGSYIESIIVEKNSTIPKPNDPTKEGYTFAGWYYNEELYNFATLVTSDMELEAKWEMIEVVFYEVSGVTLDKTNLTLTEGETSKLVATVNPNNANNKNVTWKSSDPNVVSVDSNGNIKALKPGTATITVTTKDGGYTAKATIVVKKKSEAPKPVKVTGVTLDKTNLTLTEGETSKLVATVNPNNANNKNVTWKSSDQNVVSVDSNGNIKALKPGTATITVTTKDGGYTAKATITVKEKVVIKVTGVTLDKTNLTLTEGETSKLVATVNPNNANNKNVTWKSSDPNVVSVDSNGNIKALKPGTATITVTTEDGKYTATCQIIVNEKPASYSIILTPIVMEGTGAVSQYTVSAQKNGNTFNEFAFVIYNNAKITRGHLLPVTKYDRNKTTAQIRLNDGKDVNATVIYK